MVSFHSSLSPHQLLGRRSKNLQNPDFFDMSLPKKRKRLVEEVSERSQTRIINSLLGIELPLLAPLPLEWQRCLDIKSGQVYFYNTRTKEKTTTDPRISSPPEELPAPASLDLELNLLCGGGSSEEQHHVGDNFTEINVTLKNPSCNNKIINDPITTSGEGAGGKKRSGGFLSLSRSPSWLTFDDGDQEEMVTAVCDKCHMLVMVCKATPTCPNCKFVNHPASSNHRWPIKSVLN
ncbi:unnamed protein product [Cuscuta epithymum]|uniref:WW domain-containing protein n=1 Tax=Cuscuta epithymum TaxID=186058 RepID=A0AAV0E4X9_9ASTE|nr:unnamed protein product [Cuscuta epithymum]